MPFPLLPHGQTARYDAATGQMLPAGARPPAAGRPVRIGIASDWGAGTRESAAVAALLSAFGSDHTVHMGDTYYTGDEQSYRTNFFGEAAWAGGVGVRFPAGRLGVWPLVGNHEMLARGRGYYNYARHRAGPIVEGKAAGMAASYASLETEDWRVVLLDDSYSSYPSGVASAVLSSLDLGTNCSLPPSQLAWLRAVLADPSDGRGVILLGHHNYRHAFGSSCADHAKQLAQIVPRGRELVWLCARAPPPHASPHPLLALTARRAPAFPSPCRYGHVHSFQMHNLLPPTPQAPIAAWARCVGHGGFTQEAAPLRADPLKFDARSAQAVDRRVYRTIPIASLTGTQDVDVVANGCAGGRGRETCEAPVCARLSAACSWRLPTAWCVQVCHARAGRQHGGLQVLHARMRRRLHGGRAVLHSGRAARRGGLRGGRRGQRQAG